MKFLNSIIGLVMLISFVAAPPANITGGDVGNFNETFHTNKAAIWPPICGVRDPDGYWTGGDSYYVKKGYEAMWSKGNCHANSGSCTSIECKHGAGIWFCNDNYYPWDINCAFLASYAQSIWGSCYINKDLING